MWVQAEALSLPRFDPPGPCCLLVMRECEFLSHLNITESCSKGQTKESLWPWKVLQTYNLLLYRETEYLNRSAWPDYNENGPLTHHHRETKHNLCSNRPKGNHNLVNKCLFSKFWKTFPNFCNLSPPLPTQNRESQIWLPNNHIGFLPSSEPISNFFVNNLQ